MDEAGILWRVSQVGPGTPYPFPVDGQYLVFDSREHWSGIVGFEPPPELGDLTGAELQAYRDGTSDFGGSRQGYRPPVAKSPVDT